MRQIAAAAVVALLVAGAAPDAPDTCGDFEHSMLNGSTDDYIDEAEHVIRHMNTQRAMVGLPPISVGFGGRLQIERAVEGICATSSRTRPFSDVVAEIFAKAAGQPKLKGDALAEPGLDATPEPMRKQPPKDDAAGR